MTYERSKTTIEIWLIYLRKSRQDDPSQTVEEVLAKHETMLQEYAEREFGHRIPEENIYREVVSGESIDERHEIKKVLARLEEPEVTGVLVVEPSRLSRGDLEDCARIINSFRFSHSLVATPMMTYNLENKMERKFFQDELLRGNDYLEYTKEILFRGRVAAAKRGCYVSPTPPYGYNRIKIGRDWTLEPNEKADIVRLMFNLYVKDGLTSGAIGRHLDSLGIQTANGDNWSRHTVRNILKNVHYIGKIKYNEIKETWVIENGVRVKKYVAQPPEEVIISEGKHPAIIDPELFEAAAKITAAHPRLKPQKALRNPYAGVFLCEKCGQAMNYRPNKKFEARYSCRKGCYKSGRESEIHQAILLTLEQETLPEMQKKIENGDGNAATIQKRRLEALNNQMTEYREQEEQQYELLERKRYTPEVFDRRNAALRAKMEECAKEIHKTKESMPQEVDYKSYVVRLTDAITILKDPDASVVDKNNVLRSVIERIGYSAENRGYNKTAIQLRIKPRFKW